MDLICYVSVYLPVKGWSMIVYGPEGPEYTGNGQPNLLQALKDAIDESNATEIPLDIPGLCFCPACNGIAMAGEKCDCGYEPPEYVEKERKWVALVARMNNPWKMRIIGCDHVMYPSTRVLKEIFAPINGVRLYYMVARHEPGMKSWDIRFTDDKKWAGELWAA